MKRKLEDYEVQNVTGGVNLPPAMQMPLLIGVGVQLGVFAEAQKKDARDKN